MATVRETIEIVVSGGQKVEALKNQLLAAANAAAALVDQVGEIDSRLKGADQQVATFGRNSAALSRTARVISGELGRERDYQARRRSAQDRIRALRQSGQFSQARSATERLEGRDQQRVRLRESARLLNAELAERKGILVELLQVRGIVKREKARAVAQQRLAVKLVQTDQAILERQQASLREARGSLARGARSGIAETRERSTDVLFRRRSAQANRLLTSGQSGGLSKARRAELERLSGELDQVRDRFVTLNDGLRALRETASQSGESPAKINQQLRAFAAARRETAVELGRLVQDLLEVNRTARGSRRNFDKGRRLTERVNELARVGAVDQEGRRKLISRIGAAGSARARGNIQEAQDLLEKAETTISAKERQLKLDKKLQQEARQQVRANEAASSSAVAREKQRQSALTQESKALNSIRVQQRQITDLAGKGAIGLPNFERARAGAERLPQLLQAGDYNEFKRVLGDVRAFSQLTRSDIAERAAQQKGIDNVAKALSALGRANEAVEVAAARAADIQAGLYDDSDLKQFLDGLYQTETAAKNYLGTLKETFAFQDRQRQAEEKGANNRESALDRELDRRLKLEKRQEALLRLEEQRPGSTQAGRARSLFDRLSGLGTSGRDREFARVDKELAQVLSMAGIGRKKGGTEIGPLPTGQLALPDEKLLNATGRGIKRLTTIQEEFDRRVQSGTRFQQKFNQEQERLRKLYGTAAPQGLTLAQGGRRGAGPRPLDPQAAQQRLARDLFAGQNLVGKLQNLERKRVAGFGAADPRTVEISQQVVRLETELNAAKQTGFELTKQNLDALTATINKSRQLLELDAQQNKLSGETAKIRRLQSERRLPQLQRDSLTSILGDLGRAEMSSKVFRGGRSGEQALSNIVGAFSASVGSGGSGIGAGGSRNIANMSNASMKELQLLSQALSETRESVKMTDKSFNELTQVLKKVDDQIARRDPNADFLTRRFGQRGGQAVGEGLIGGAFPLLFGQGAGAAAVGGLGGFLGGMAGGTLGFGLSLAGTAIGSQVDALMQATQDTGNMLRDLVGNFEQIKESGLLASRSQEKLISNLLEAGNKTAAYAIIQDELNRKLGVDGAAKLREAADAGDRLKRAMADLGVQIQLLVAGPLTDILNAIASILERQNLEGAVKRGLAEAPEPLRRSVEAGLARRKGESTQSPISSILDFWQATNPIGMPLFLKGFAERIANPVDVSTTSTEGLRQAAAQLQAGMPATAMNSQERRDKAIIDAETRRDTAQRQLEAFNKRNEGVDILKGFKQQANAIRREQEDINRQSFELRRDYERQIEDIRRGVEDRISQLRQENAQKELEILVKQGQIREQQFKNAATTLQGALAGDPLAQSLADAVTTYLGAQLSAQNEIEQRRKQFEIEINNQQVELEKYKLDVARTISRLNTDTVEKVAQINLGIARRNEDAALNVFATEKQTAKLRFQLLGTELRVLEAKELSTAAQASAEAQRNPLMLPEYTVQYDTAKSNATRLATAVDNIFKNLIPQLEQIAPPPRLGEIAPVATRGVSLAGVNAQKARGDQLRAQFQAFSDELTGLVETGNFAEFTNRISEIGRGGFDELSNNLDTARKELALVGGDFGPIAQGITDAYQKVIDDLPRLTAKLTPELQAQVPALKRYLEVAKQSQIQLEKLRPTLEFYITGYGDLKSQTEQAKNGISELLSPTKNYDRLLEQINKRGGLGINEEETRRLLQAAKNLDELNARLKVLNGLNDIAGGWTDSFIQLNKELLKGGNLLESVQRFAEGVADRTLDVVLEFTLRPIQEQLFKNLSKVLGIEAPQDPTLLPIKETAQNTKDLVDLQKRQFAGQTGIKPPEPANNIVAGPSAAPAAPAFDTGMRTGPAGRIGSGTAYHQDIMFGSGVSLEDRVKYMDQLARGYEAMGRVIEFSNAGVANRRYLSTDPIERRRQLILDAQAAHANRPGGSGRAAMDFYAPLAGQTRFGPSVEGQVMLAPVVPGGTPSYSSGGGAGRKMTMMKDGQMIYEMLHGDTGIPLKPASSSILGPRSSLSIGDQFTAMVISGNMGRIAGTQATGLFAAEPGGRKAYPLPANYPYLPGEGPAATQQVTPPTAPITEATKPIVELGVQAKTTADGVKDLGTEMSDSVTKFQKTVGAGLQAISSIAMGVGGAQMIRKGGAYNTLMGAASIFGSISSITGMFGTGGGLSGLFGGKPKSSLPGFTGEMLNLGGLGLPGYASGGRPDPYDPAIIGENGPELWVPDRPGTIIPNDELYVPGLDDKGGSAPSIGRYARRAASSMESGDGESGDTIYTGNYGRAVPYQRSETTREIDRLERITTNPKELPPIKYETTRVNEYDFVTPEQLEASNARTAKIARNQTIRELADSMKTRKRLGL